MFYPVVKIWIRLAMWLFCRKVTINDRTLLRHKGPLLLACNHPNSFLDAIIIGSSFKEPVHFLARGDAFRKPFVRKLLTKLKMIPIYRLSEGREYLALNDATFDRCRDILLQGGIVLIFAEGLCVNQWDLRPLKKGAARIALDAWDDTSITHTFKVLPVSLNYNSYTRFGKRLIIHFAEPLTQHDLLKDAPEGESIHHFNSILASRLKQGMLQSHNDQEIIQYLISNHRTTNAQLIPALRKKQEYASQHQSIQAIQKLKSPYLIAAGPIMFLTNLLAVLALFLPAAAGWILHAPLYLPLRNFIRAKTKRTVFFDSVFFGALLITYPLYWILINSIVMLLTDHFYVRCLFGLMAFLAWLYIIWKDCVQRVKNYLSLYSTNNKNLRNLFG